MFSAYLNKPSVWQPVLQQAVVRESLAWLQANAMSAAFGRYHLGEPNWYANVHGYETQPEAQCLWENHRHTIDIQYLLSGSEGIRWIEVSQLGKLQQYIEEQDREEYQSSCAAGSLLAMRPGMFAIFLPGDAHCPKIALGDAETLRKVVVKIPLQLLEGDE